MTQNALGGRSRSSGQGTWSKTLDGFLTVRVHHKHVIRLLAGPVDPVRPADLRCGGAARLGRGDAGAGARAECGGKLAARERRIRKGRKLRLLRQEPRDGEQINTTDADSGLMRRNDRSEFRRSWVRQTSKTLLSPPTPPCRDQVALIDREHPKVRQLASALSI